MSRKRVEKGKHWTDSDKLKALAAYLMTGNASRVEELTGIPAGTVNYWKTLPWWFEETEKLRKAEDENLVSRYTKVIQKTMDKLETVLETGDEVLLKDGTKARREVSARDLAVITSVMADKRHKTRANMVEQHVRQVTVGERLKQLEEQFTKFVTSKVVDGEIIHKVVEITAPEVKDAENSETISETTGGEGCEERLCSGSEPVTEARNIGEGEFREVDGEGKETQLNVSFGAG